MAQGYHMDNLELHGDVEACMMGVMSANQNYDTTADQNYDTTADQNYDTTANQNDDSDDTSGPELRHRC